MTDPKTLSPNEIAIARTMYEYGRGIEYIARHFKCSRGNVHRTLKAAGVKMRGQGAQPGVARGPRKVVSPRDLPRDPVTNDPIGQIPEWIIEIQSGDTWVSIPPPKHWNGDIHRTGDHVFRRIRHPLYEADQEMLRSRQKRPRAEGGWQRSSITWD